MPQIHGFRGIHYDFRRYADLTPVLAPPYDVIDAAYRDALEARDPHNVVRLELEKERPGDGGAESKYSRSARWLQEWLAAGVLSRDDAPALYALDQTFTVDGQRRTRRGFFTRLRLHAFEEGVVLPHERTLSGPKADRMELVKAVRANVSPIFLLYPDDPGEVQKLIDPELERPPDAEGATDNDATTHRLWRVSAPAVLAAVSEALAARKGYIADGHHRYETGLGYARWCEQTQGARPEGAHRWILAYLCGMSDPGLSILPTHRVLFGLPGLGVPRLLTLLAEHFEVEELAEDPSRASGRAWALRRLAEAGRTGHAMLLVARADRKARLLKLKEGVDLAHVSALPKNPTLRTLDVTVLHSLILQHGLGLSPESQARKENLEYVKDAGDAIEQVLHGTERAYQLAFLLNATPMWQVRAVSEAGEVMPQKSTFFFPKVPTGLVINPVDPADPA